jgi:hypothetical protein
MGNPITYKKEGLEMKEVSLATEAFLKAVTAKEQAEIAYDEARLLLLDSFAMAGVDSHTFAELTVSVSPSPRRSWALDKLKDAVSPALFRRLTKPAIDTKAWDSAVEKGEISPKVIKTVVDTSDTVRVLVKPAKGAEKPATTVVTTKKAKAS